MTDVDMADAVYVEPLTVEIVEKIIEKEKPDGILPTMGGQTGLNLAVKLQEKGILKKHNVETLGTSIASIEQGEDREQFKQLMNDIKEPIPKSQTVTNLKQAKAFEKEIGLPIVIRPAYTLGGTGGGIAFTKEEFETITQHGINLSPIKQVLLEKAILGTQGWGEFELEVMRDKIGRAHV